jgi:microsomal dipeptidase-like Zn-dependent dipeptidase
MHKSLIVGDWHADSALWNRDLKKTYDYGHVDIPRLQKGNVALQMFTTVTKSPAGQNYTKNSSDSRDNITALAIVQMWPIRTWFSLYERAIFQSNKIRSLAERDPNNFMLIESRIDLDNFLLKRKNNPELVGGLIGTEGSHALDGNIDNVERLYKNGFRMMSLQHFFDNKLGGSLHGTSGNGLTEFGIKAVNEMMRLDIIIDLSHSSQQVVQDVLKISDQPLVISHTGFNGHCKSPRNISDTLMKEIALKGGLIAVGFWDAAICDNTPKVVAEAINFGINLIGVDHVSLGSDFDGTIAPGFDTSELEAITHELIELGLDEIEIRKVMGLNMLTFLQNNLPKN